MRSVVQDDRQREKKKKKKFKNTAQT